MCEKDWKKMIMNEDRPNERTRKTHSSKEKKEKKIQRKNINK